MFINLEIPPNIFFFSAKSSFANGRYFLRHAPAWVYTGKRLNQDKSGNTKSLCRYLVFSGNTKSLCRYLVFSDFALWKVQIIPSDVTWYFLNLPVEKFRLYQVTTDVSHLVFPDFARWKLQIIPSDVTWYFLNLSVD